MDPDAVLTDALATARHIIEYADPDDSGDRDGVDLAQNVLDLHRWISGGGFLPTDWREALNRAARS